jgi:signal peptidase I
MWHPIPFMHRDEAVDRLKQKDSPFEIIRKPPDKILRMMRIVYDNDHQPRDQKDVVPPRWAPDKDAQGSWESAGPTGYRHKGNEGEQLGFLRYSHRLRHGIEPELITDCMGYNNKVYHHSRWDDKRLEHPALPRNWVGDLILEFDVTLESTDGELVLELSKGVDRFRAAWQLSSGNCTLSRLADGKEFKLETQATKLKKKGTFRLRFANVDERLTVWVDGDLPFGDGVTYKTPAERGPTANDLQPASIGIKGGSAAFSKLRLFRDTYYTVSPSAADSRAIQDILHQSAGPAEEELHHLLSDPTGWGTAFGNLPGTTLYVQPDHYLCLGDNSPESSDGRNWGLVPKRLLLGRALLVYWPFSRAGTIK